MITKVDKENFIQKCRCGSLHTHEYYDLSIKDSYVSLPLCVDCGSLEVLINTMNGDSHALLVSRVFANIASLYSKIEKKSLRTDKSKKPPKPPKGPK